MSSTQKRAILQVRIREEDKQHAERLYDAMGTSLAEAVRLFVAQSILMRKLPFQPVAVRSKDGTPFVMRWAMSMAWPVSTMSNAKSCGHMRRQIAEGCMASRVLLTFLSIWMAGQTMAASPRREQR